MLWLLLALWLVPPLLVFIFGLYCLNRKLKHEDGFLVTKKEVTNAILFYMIPFVGVFYIVLFILSFIIESLISVLVRK